MMKDLEFEFKGHVRIGHFDVKIKSDNTTIDLGMIDSVEAKELKAKLIDAIEWLDDLINY